MAGSKWLNTASFKQFSSKIKEETERATTSNERVDRKTIWKPEKGTSEKPKVYEGRLLPDKANNFYKRYFYHMYKVGEGWKFSLCPKTYDMNAFCEQCAVSNKLYMGTKEDKKEAYLYKRKERFVVNAYISNDPMDADRDAEDKVTGTNKLWEFPAKLEKTFNQEITDQKNGRGMAIFDPGEDGYDFFLKIGATKPDQEGKVWADYSTSTFAIRPGAIGTDEEIEQIMDRTMNLDDYIKSMVHPREEIIGWLKQNLVYELIERDVEKHLAQEGKETQEDFRTAAKKEAAPVTEEAEEYSPEDEDPEVKEEKVVPRPAKKKVEEKPEPTPAPAEENDEESDDDLLASLAALRKK